MKKFAIIETWNGEGYSEENFIKETKEFNTKAEALAYCKSLAKIQGELEKTPDGWCFLTNNDVDDAGSYQALEIEKDHYGMGILCNINEAELLTKEAYFKALAQAKKQADPHDEIEDGDRIFIASYGGDYDYVFEKLYPLENLVKTLIKTIEDNTTTMWVDSLEFTLECVALEDCEQVNEGGDITHSPEKMNLDNRFTGGAISDLISKIKAELC